MSERNVTVGVYTLGCKVNQYESEAICEEFEARGCTVLSADKPCDIYVINTCTVTAESDRKARQFIRRAHSQNPSAFILVCGCMAQTSPDEISKIDGVDYICGNTSKLSVVTAALDLIDKRRKNSAAQIFVDDIDKYPFEKMSISKFDRTRAYVKIEDGCESHCTYCIIPSARGKIRSKAPLDVINEVERLTRSGCKEVVLTGIETASYGKDLDGIDLATLICKVDKIPGIGRVRLGSLDPSLITPTFVNKISGVTSLAPHFHLSLQSGSDRVLALMKRKYNSDMAARAIELLREAFPSAQFTTDVIVGFPGESDGDFERTVEFAKKARFLKIHIFPYSKRKGTLAAQMPDQISKQAKHERLTALSEIESATRAAILENEIKSGIIQNVLFESFDGKMAFGHAANFIEVAAPSDAPLHSQVKKVKLLSTDGNVCLAQIQD